MCINERNISDLVLIEIRQNEGEVDGNRKMERRARKITDTDRGSHVYRTDNSVILL